MTHTTQEQKPKRLRKWIIIALAAFIILWIIGTAIGTDDTTTEAEPEPTQTEQVETAEPETEPEPEKPEPSETKEQEPEATTPPQGIKAQIAELNKQDGFKETEIFYAEDDNSVNIYMTIEPGWSESTMCRDARQHTINGLKFLRDNVNEPYGEAQFSFTAEGEPDATGNSATLPMAHLVYEYDTVQAINDDTVYPDNVWDAADGGGKGTVCKRAED